MSMDSAAPVQDRGLRLRWRELVGLASGLSVIVGVVISLSQLHELVDSSQRTDMTRRLAALGHVKQFLADDVEVNRRGRRFMREVLSELKPQIEQRILAAGSGAAFYLSEEMVDYAAMQYHYEQLGALVKLGYIDFTLVYEVIAFPDEYMDAIAPVQRALATHWKGQHRALDDLGANIQFLRACYQKARANPKREPTCP